MKPIAEYGVLSAWSTLDLESYESGNVKMIDNQYLSYHKDEIAEVTQNRLFLLFWTAYEFNCFLCHESDNIEFSVIEKAGKIVALSTSLSAIPGRSQIQVTIHSSTIHSFREMVSHHLQLSNKRGLEGIMFLYPLEYKTIFQSFGFQQEKIHEILLKLWNYSYEKASIYQQ